MSPMAKPYAVHVPQLSTCWEGRGGSRLGKTATVWDGVRVDGGCQAPAEKTEKGSRVGWWCWEAPRVREGRKEEAVEGRARRVRAHGAEGEACREGSTAEGLCSVSLWVWAAGCAARACASASGA
eukprot:scaffold24214_cov107-Isochrysis_galbana.AAC.2